MYNGERVDRNLPSITYKIFGLDLPSSVAPVRSIDILNSDILRICTQKSASPSKYQIESNSMAFGKFLC